MNRSSLLVACEMALWGFLSAGAWGAAEPDRRPNVLLIMTDQQSAEALGCQVGDKYLCTPAMDSLADRGVVFTKAYAANPLCVPSRTAIFTGRYPHQTGAQTNKFRSLDLARFPCLGTLFKQAGYDTGYVGKWHLPISRKNRTAHGFDFMENIKGNGGDADTPAPAMEFLRRKRQEPFFLVVSAVNPHNICEWARGERLPDGAIGDPPPVDECPPLRTNHGHPKNETDTMALMRRSFQANPMFPVGRFDEKKWRQYAWAYYRMIEMVDGQIGTILDALQASGQEDDTLVIFTSDHGDCQGAHKWNQKTVFYDESTRVPLIISWPGITATGTSDRLVNTGVDLIPTLCDYAAIAPPDGLPGSSLKATANGLAPLGAPKFVVVSNEMVQGAEVDGQTPQPQGRMLRSPQYKYCVYSLGQRPESLVDMKNDPGEMVNLAQDAQYQHILQQHRRYLRQWCQTHGDDFGSLIPR